MDKIGADFYFSVRTMGERLGANAVPIQLPSVRRPTSKASSTWWR